MKTVMVQLFGLVLVATLVYFVAEAVEHLTTCEGEKFDLRAMSERLVQ